MRRERECTQKRSLGEGGGGEGGGGEGGGGREMRGGDRLIETDRQHVNL